VGWIGARGPVLDRLTALKQASDCHTATLIQHLAARYLAAGGHARQLARTLPLLRERRDELLASVERELGDECDVDPPRGGHHLWLTLRRPVDERALLGEAVRQGVCFMPGGAVTVERSKRTSLRVSFSLLEPDELRTGVKRLARALRELRRRDRAAVAVPLS
jgi:DNA-binding transcriptional MocR family regulator